MTVTFFSRPGRESQQQSFFCPYCCLTKETLPPSSYCYTYLSKYPTSNLFASLIISVPGFRYWFFKALEKSMHPSNVFSDYHASAISLEAE